MGIDINKVISLTFVIGAALGAVAGVMVGSYYGIAHYQMGFILGLKAFSAAVLGGIGNLAGAMLGGLLLGAHRGPRRGLRRRPHEPVQPVELVRRARAALRAGPEPHAVRLQLPGRVRVPGADRGPHLPAVGLAGRTRVRPRLSEVPSPAAAATCCSAFRACSRAARRAAAAAARSSRCIPRIRSTRRSRSRSRPPSWS